MFEAFIRRFFSRSSQPKKHIMTPIPTQATTQRVQNGARNGFVPRISPATVRIGLNSYALFEPHIILTSTPTAILALKANQNQRQPSAEAKLEDDSNDGNDGSAAWIADMTPQFNVTTPDAATEYGDEDDAHDTSSAESSEYATSSGGSGTITPDSSVEDGDQLSADGSEEPDVYPQYERIEYAILQGTLSPLPDPEMPQTEDESAFRLNQGFIFNEDSVSCNPTVDDPTSTTQPHDDQANAEHFATVKPPPVPDSSSTSTSPQPTNAILPPLILPAWSDDGAGNMWEEAFEKLTEAAQDSAISAPEQDVPQSGSPLPPGDFCRTVQDSPVEDDNGLPRCVLPHWSNAGGDMWAEAFDEGLEAEEETAATTDDGITRPCTPLPWPAHDDAENLSHDRADETLYTMYNTHPAHHEPTHLQTLLKEDVSLPDDDTASIVEYTKHHYTSPEGRERLEYIKEYMSLHPAMSPVHLVFFFIEPGRQKALRQAAWENPAFLRATLELDFDGILHELPWPTEEPNPYLEHYWNLMEGWLEWYAHLLPDVNDETLPLKEWESCNGVSWEQLLDYVEEEPPSDTSILKRWVDKWEGAERDGGVTRREWVGHGPSRLRIVTLVDEE